MLLLLLLYNTPKACIDEIGKSLLTLDLLDNASLI